MSESQADDVAGALTRLEEQVTELHEEVRRRRRLPAAREHRRTGDASRTRQLRVGRRARRSGAAPSPGAEAPARGTVPRGRRRGSGDRGPGPRRDRRRDGRGVGARRAHRMGGLAGRSPPGASRVHARSVRTSGRRSGVVQPHPSSTRCSRVPRATATRRSRASRLDSTTPRRRSSNASRGTTRDSTGGARRTLPRACSSRPPPSRSSSSSSCRSRGCRCRGRTAGGRSSSSRATSSTAGWDWRFVLLLAGCTLWNQVLAVRIWRTARRAGGARRCSSLALAGNLGVLGYFKYYDFFVSSTRQRCSTIVGARPAVRRCARSSCRSGSRSSRSWRSATSSTPTAATSSRRRSTNSPSTSRSSRTSSPGRSCRPSEFMPAARRRRATRAASTRAARST